MTRSPDCWRRVDDLGAGHAVLELAQARLDLPLALLGGVVLGVLRDVPVRARRLDLPHDARPVLGTQAPELLLEQARSRAGSWEPDPKRSPKQDDAPARRAS